jgi:hypothetical protein
MVFLGGFSPESIASDSDATWIYYVKTKKPKKNVGLNQWFFHANP